MNRALGVLYSTYIPTVSIHEPRHLREWRQWIGAIVFQWPSSNKDSGSQFLDTHRRCLKCVSNATAGTLLLWVSSLLWIPWGWSQRQIEPRRILIKYTIHLSRTSSIIFRKLLAATRLRRLRPQSVSEEGDWPGPPCQALVRSTPCQRGPGNMEAPPLGAQLSLPGTTEVPSDIPAGGRKSPVQSVICLLCKNFKCLKTNPSATTRLITVNLAATSCGGPFGPERKANSRAVFLKLAAHLESVGATTPPPNYKPGVGGRRLRNWKAFKASLVSFQCAGAWELNWWRLCGC